MKFRWKIFSLVILSICALGISVGYFSYYYATNIALQSRKEDISRMVNLIDININTRIRQINHSIQEYFKEKDLQIEKIEAHQLNEICDRLDPLHHEIYSIMFVTKDQILYKPREMQRMNIFSPSQLMQSQQINKAEQSPDTVYWGNLTPPLLKVFEDSSNKIFTTYAGENCVIGFEYNADIFQSLIPSAQGIFKDQYIFIIDQNNRVIIGNKVVDRAWKNFLSKMDVSLLQSEIEIGGKLYYYRLQNNGLTGWKTIAFIPTARIFPENNTLRSIILYCVISGTVIASLLVYLIAKELTDPLEKLTEAMDRVQKENDYSIRVGYKVRDEVGQLTYSFNQLLSKVQYLIEEVYENKIMQRNAEIEALQAQINPHFLYNSLDSINWMLIEKKEYEISSMVVALGDIFKYSMDTRHSMVTLKDEMEHIQSYLMIQKNRFEEKLKYEIKISEMLYSLKIPKLILQPIVENSIYHAVEKGGADDRVNIEVLAKENAEFVVLLVVDNGKGIEPMQLEKIRSSLGNDSDLNRIGLRNVHRRLQLYFGENYGLEIDSEWEKGTTVRLSVPKQWRGDNGHCNSRR